jgi:hypothetical protein
MVEAEDTLLALRADYVNAQQLRAESLAKAEALSMRMQNTCIHFFRVKDQLSRYQCKDTKTRLRVDEGNIPINFSSELYAGS